MAVVLPDEVFLFLQLTLTEVHHELAALHGLNVNDVHGQSNWNIDTSYADERIESAYELLDEYIFLKRAYKALEECKSCCGNLDKQKGVNHE